MPAYTPGPWRIGFEDGTGWMDDEDGGWIIGSEEEVVVVGGSHDILPPLRWRVARHAALSRRNRGVKRIGVIHAANVYGQYFVDRAPELASELGYTFVGHQPLPRNPDDAITEMRALREQEPDVVIMALYPAGARKVVEAKASLGWSDVRLVSSGPLTDEQYLNVEGGHAEGTLGFCHYPDPNENDAPGIVEYRKLMATYFPGHELNRYSLYGYVFAKLVVEGLERVGKDLTRDKFLDAMESICNWDSGGILPAVSFSETDHHAPEGGLHL